VHSQGLTINNESGKDEAHVPNAFFALLHTALALMLIYLRFTSTVVEIMALHVTLQ